MFSVKFDGKIKQLLQDAHYCTTTKEDDKVFI